MKYTATYKNINASKALNENIIETFDKFEDYFDHDFSCHATISNKGKTDENKCVEITITTGKYTFRAESTTNDFYKSVDMNFDKIKKQIRRHKDKLAIRKRETIRIDNTEDIPEIKPEIVRNKKFKAYPMSVEEAVMQMDLLGHNFFIFLNEETERINVVYKRNDEGYGLIDIQ